MGSSRQEDRSLTGNISLPQWMKTKFDNKYDFDDSAFSPPSHDDSFFYVRYPKGQQQQKQNCQQSQTRSHHQQQQQQQQQFSRKELRTNDITSSTNLLSSNVQSTSVFKEVKNLDFSKHTAPCLPYIPNAEGKVSDVKSVKTVIAGKVKPKSLGTDDGFQSDPALCGKSIVQVANQMITSQMSAKHAKVPPNESRVMGTEQRQDRCDQLEAADQFLELKKGSKSLPATPLTSPMVSPDSSPKSRRKHINRYFTGPFIPDKEKYQGSWLLASILGQSREIMPGKIEEEDESGLELAPPPKTLSRKKSISSQNLTYIGKDEKFFATGKQPIGNPAFQPKPSELREMNFWSPTSM